MPRAAFGWGQTGCDTAGLASAASWKRRLNWRVDIVLPRLVPGNSQRSSGGRADPGQIATWSVETCDEPDLNGVPASHENDWYGLGSPLRSKCSGSARRRDCRRLEANQIGGKSRQPIIPRLGRTIFDPHVPAFDVAGLRQASAEAVLAPRLKRVSD